MNIKIGDAFFLRDLKSFYGKAINFYNNEEFSDHKGEWLPTHVGQVCAVEKDRILIAEAGPNGYLVDGNWYPLEKIVKLISEDKVRFKRSKIKLSNVYETCKKYENTPYDYWTIFKIILFHFTHYSGLIWNGDKNLMCSEAETRVLYEESEGKILLGYNKNKPEEKKKSEYKIYYELISPAHIYLSKYLEDIQ